MEMRYLSGLGYPAMFFIGLFVGIYRDELISWATDSFLRLLVKLKIAERCGLPDIEDLE